MKSAVVRILAISAMVASISGCAIYPAVQVAGAAMTGYDAISLAQDTIPRTSVDGGKSRLCPDEVLERRLQERLTINELRGIAARVIDSQAFLVGRLPDRAAADKAVLVASTVEGITVINCKFFPMPGSRQAERDKRTLETLKTQLSGMKALDDTDLHMDVISGNAILLGTARTRTQSTAVVKTAARVSGVSNVVNYIVVDRNPDTAQGS